jgi:Kef-type K+ transport system membrane component KefB
VLVMIGINALGKASEFSLAQAVLAVLVKGSAFIVVIGLVSRYLLPRLLHVLSCSQELLVLFGIAWAVALVTAGDALGFSKEVGAFVAGVSLASTPYRDALGRVWSACVIFCCCFSLLIWARAWILNYWARSSWSPWCFRCLS